MNRRDFLRLIGADQMSADYLPVAVLLRSGYGCAGYFNTSINQGLDEMVVLLNARLIGLKGSGQQGGDSKALIGDFNQFLEQIVLHNYKDDDKAEQTISDAYGKSIPLAAIQINEIAVLYPVAQIGKMLRHIHKEKEKTQPKAAKEKEPAPAPITLAADHAPAPAPSPAAAHPAPDEKHHVKIPDEIELAVQKYDGMVGVADSSWPGAADEELSTKALDHARARRPLQQPAKAPAASGVAPVGASQAPVATPAAAAHGTPAANPAKPHLEEEHLPSFLDFNNKSVVLSMLRTKLW